MYLKVPSQKIGDFAREMKPGTFSIGVSEKIDKENFLLMIIKDKEENIIKKLELPKVEIRAGAFLVPGAIPFLAILKIEGFLEPVPFWLDLPRQKKIFKVGSRTREILLYLLSSFEKAFRDPYYFFHTL